MTEQRACATDEVLHRINDARDALHDVRSIVTLVEMATEHNPTDENNAISFACAQAVNKVDDICARLALVADLVKGGAQ
ncbi:hypothetical protein C8J27_103193 [Rhodobacter aestuarii]|uniref:Uncharacterized protein n=1 Tax=Rhodobacter aestuarii TaxID=453582 RepID=A0A1N7K4B9_9RHOB|nr:hypothetical protein [Rhodobacter aestuarii]PTV95864.1 hypothetical protein C8J27_103193 [Rhodobacter aestuarii]SIS56396.1 hypothetical protein SAMN05421580_102241 [Rhodobacter aestuarii]